MQHCNEKENKDISEGKIKFIEDERSDKEAINGLELCYNWYKGKIRQLNSILDIKNQ